MVPILLARRHAGMCLILVPFVYSLGVNFYHNSQFRFLGESLIFMWIVISLIVGMTAALTYRLQIFGLNCGTFLCYSVIIILLAWTLQVKEIALGTWLMYGCFIAFFLRMLYATDADKDLT